MSYSTRAEAEAVGAARYFPGTPCRRGHVCERYTSTGNCVRCTRLTGRRALAPRGWEALQVQVEAGREQDFFDLVELFGGYEVPEKAVRVVHVKAEAVGEFLAAVEGLGPGAPGAGGSR